MMRTYNTGDIQTGLVSFLLYGLSGAGKTPLASTLPQPAIIISTEPGLLSLKEYKLDYIVAQNYKEAKDALAFVASPACNKYKSVYFDSIAAIADNIKKEEKTRYKGDPRKWSPAVVEQVMELIFECLRVPGKHRGMTTKALEIRGELGSPVTVEPYAVVPALSADLPYHFDLVTYLSRHRNPQDMTKEYVALRCQANDDCKTRDRSGKLGLWEPANLTHVINKINGVV